MQVQRQQHASVVHNPQSLWRQVHARHMWLCCARKELWGVPAGCLLRVRFLGGELTCGPRNRPGSGGRQWGNCSVRRDGAPTMTAAQAQPLMPSNVRAHTAVQAADRHSAAAKTGMGAPADGGLRGMRGRDRASTRRAVLAVALLERRAGQSAVHTSRCFSNSLRCNSHWQQHDARSASGTLTGQGHNCTTQTHTATARRASSRCTAMQGMRRSAIPPSQAVAACRARSWQCIPHSSRCATTGQLQRHARRGTEGWLQWHHLARAVGTRLAARVCIHSWDLKRVCAAQAGQQRWPPMASSTGNECCCMSLSLAKLGSRNNIDATCSGDPSTLLPHYAGCRAHTQS
jgi:hypothetical protein